MILKPGEGSCCAVGFGAEPLSYWTSSRSPLLIAIFCASSRPSPSIRGTVTLDVPLADGVCVAAGVGVGAAALKAALELAIEFSLGVAELSWEGRTGVLTGVATGEDGGTGVVVGDGVEDPSSVAVIESCSHFVCPAARCKTRPTFPTAHTSGRLPLPFTATLLNRHAYKLAQ